MGINTRMPLTRRGKWLMALCWVLICLVIIADQSLKVWIKTHFYLNEDFEITSWFHLHFVQNNGMAFGLDFIPKHLLTFLRMGLFGFLVWYIGQLVRRAWIPTGYLVSVALIAAGAFGNIVDCVLYGEIFTNPMPPGVASVVPWGEGYGGVFQGLVVDMLYFPLFSFEWPQWLPLLGGRTFSFFDPVFNIADVSISTGMIAIVLFYFNLMEHSLEDEKPSAD